MNEQHNMIVESNYNSPPVLLIHLFCSFDSLTLSIFLNIILMVMAMDGLHVLITWYDIILYIVLHITVTWFFPRNLRRPFPRAVFYQNLNGVVSVFNKVVDGDIMLFIGKVFCVFELFEFNSSSQSVVVVVVIFPTIWIVRGIAVYQEMFSVQSF